jgi:hypothetical protein
MFIWVLVLCLICSVAFAGFATWLSTTRGNTVKETMEARHLSDEDALKLALGKLNIATTLPIVALYLIALAMGVGLPGFIWWENARNADFITVNGQFDRRPAYPVCIEKDDPYSGTFSWQIPYAEGSQHIVFWSPVYVPVTMKFTLSKEKGTLNVDVVNFGPTSPFREEKSLSTSRTIDLDGHIPLVAASPAAVLSGMPAAASLSPGVSDPKLSKIKPPPGEQM